MTQRPHLHRSISLIAMCIVLAATILTPMTGTAHQRATPPAGFDSALLQDALPWDLPRDAERRVVHRIVDGDTVQLTYPKDD